MFAAFFDAIPIALRARHAHDRAHAAARRLPIFADTIRCSYTPDAIIAFFIIFADAAMPRRCQIIFRCRRAHFRRHDAPADYAAISLDHLRCRPAAMLSLRFADRRACPITRCAFAPPPAQIARRHAAMRRRRQTAIFADAFQLP